MKSFSSLQIASPGEKGARKLENGGTPSRLLRLTFKEKTRQDFGEEGIVPDSFEGGRQEKHLL